MRLPDFEGTHLALARLARASRPAPDAEFEVLASIVDAIAAAPRQTPDVAQAPRAGGQNSRPELWSAVLKRLVRQDRFAVLPDGWKKRRRAT